jgi:hypothetical protein
LRRRVLSQNPPEQNPNMLRSRASGSQLLRL